MSQAITPMRRRAYSVALLAACFLLSGGLASADAPKVDPAAQKVVDGFGKFYAGLKGFRVTADVAITIESQGQKQQQEFKQRISMRRPNELSFVLDAPSLEAAAVSNGKSFSLYFGEYGKDATEQAPATLQEILQDPLVAHIVRLGNGGNLTAALLGDDPAARLLEKVESLEYGGIVELAGMKCHLLKAAADPLDWQIWIDAGKQPLVRQFAPDVEKAFAERAEAEGRTLGDMKIRNIIRYPDWELDPKFSDDAFAFNPPAGAIHVDTFADILHEPSETFALLGKPAPPLNLPLVDGGRLDLASFKGKDVVILDFWATWCGPCRQAMPIIDRVAEKYKDQGVRLFAVNVDDGPDAIRAFLDATKLKVPVAMDVDGTAVESYMANLLPQTVLVGKDGTVQVVNIGASPYLEKSLTREVEALVAGQDLAAQELAKLKKIDEQAKALRSKASADEN